MSEDKFEARLKKWATRELALEAPTDMVTRVTTETTGGCDTCEFTTAEITVVLESGRVFGAETSFGDFLESMLDTHLDEDGVFNSAWAPFFKLAEVHWETSAKEVLDLVMEHRRKQVAQYGLNDECQNGTGPEVKWLAKTGINLDLRTADEIEAAFRAEYEKHGFPDWMRLVREEVAEAFKESDPKRLEEELIQVAALCTSWVEYLRRNYK